MSVPVSPIRGSVILMLFACVGMVAAVGVASMNLMRGPVKAMSQVTKRTLAENSMMASGRLTLVMSARTPSDCDQDGMIEPLEWTDAGSLPKPVHGGLLPANVGASLKDPWGTEYGYCSWDQGNITAAAGCGAGARRLVGGTAANTPVIAVISAGPDHMFDTGCQAQGQGVPIMRVPGSDDIVLSYTYADAMALSGGLWNLKDGDTQTATISKNITVTDSGGHEQLSFDAQSKDLSLGTGGTGNLPNIKTDYIQNLTPSAPIEFLSNIKTADVQANGKVQAMEAAISNAQANAVAAIVTASGTSAVGLKAKGTSKAIESDGVLDMLSNKIVNLAAPSIDTDAATKKYVDDKTAKVTAIRCDGFMSTSCSGSGAQNLTKTTLGACKAACEAAGVQCCEATFPLLSNNPNATLTSCKGYAAPSQPGGIAGLLGGLFGTVAAFCYQQ